jgi:hypothetical protein
MSLKELKAASLNYRNLLDRASRVMVSSVFSEAEQLKVKRQDFAVTVSDT